MALPKTLHMIIIGVVIFVSAFGFSIFNLEKEAALTATLGIFLVVLGLISYGIILVLKWIETRGLSRT